MNNLKKFLTALKENTDGARKKAFVAIGTVAVSLAAGIILTKLSEDRVDVILLQESTPEEPETEQTEF